MKDVYWIGDSAETMLAIVARPRGGEWLESELLRLKRSGVDVLVSMLTGEEELELGLEAEREVADRLGLTYYSYPIPDRSTPGDLDTFRALIIKLADEIKRGKRVGAHCRGSIGRATLITASILISEGWKADRALIVIEAARGCPVPDTAEQRHWVESLSIEGR